MKRRNVLDDHDAEVGRWWCRFPELGDRFVDVEEGFVGVFFHVGKRSGGGSGRNGLERCEDAGSVRCWCTRKGSVVTGWDNLETTENLVCVMRTDCQRRRGDETA